MNSNAVSPVHLDQILVGKYRAETSDNSGAFETDLRFSKKDALE